MRQSGASSSSSNGASGQNREQEEGPIVNELATTNREAIVRGFVTTTKQSRDRDVTNRGFPHQRYKASKLRPTLTKSQTV